MIRDRHRRWVTAMWLLLLCAGIGPLQADQNDRRLDTLFDDLQDAADSAEAALIESRIWAIWLDAPDEVSAELLDEVVRAMGEGDMERALVLNNRLVEHDAGFAEAWNKRATLHYLMGHPDRSVADISETLAREPKHFGAISGLGLIFMQRGDYEAALDAFEQVLDISPQSASARRGAEQIRSELESDI